MSEAKVKAVTKFRFCSGHRLLGHENKCANLHGHNYHAFIHAEAEDLSNQFDAVGRVIDFAVLKEKIGGWILENWDHTMILYEKDAKTIELVKQCERNKEIFVMDANPTAENMAKYLIEQVCPQVLQGTGVVVRKIILWETEDSFAEATLEA